MSEFPISPIDRFAGSSAAIRRPKEITSFSYDDTHTLHHDDRSLRYYYPPTLPADLSRGFETFEKLDEEADLHLEGLLGAVERWERERAREAEAAEGNGTGPAPGEVDFVTWRGMMTKIMATPFDDFNSYEMNATLFQGTIFIEENHGYKLTQQNRQRRQPPPRHGGPSQDLMSYWGYKFETLSLLPDQWDATSREYIEGREDEIVNNYAQYCSVVKTGIGGAKMILGGEVDAVWDAKPFPATDQPINWVELKTAAEIRSDKDMLKFERKLLKFWIQSFLLGVPKIVVGFRTPDGILTRLEELETKSLPGNVKRMGRGSWDGNLCINFAAAFLEFLKNTITTEGGVYRIRHRERNSVVEVFKVEETGHGNILTPEFVRWREELAGKHRAKTTTAAEST